MRIFLAFTLLVACLFIPAQSAFALRGQLGTEGVEFVLRLDDGRVLRREALIGIRMVLANRQGQAEVRIDGVDEDATATGGPVLLYRLSVRSADGREAHPFCLPDPRGRSAGFPLPDGSGGFSFTCTSGAEGKCALMGYRPWESTEGRPMRDLHRVCVHMLRADYGGDDRPTTRDGTTIDIFDRFGIQVSDKADGMEFEAAWGPEGAVCVAHPRIAENVTLKEIARRHPHLAGRLGPQACSREAMRAEPRALLFNHSFPGSPSPH